MSLRLPRIEQFEEGQQIRRSIKSVRSNIVEGYGRRYYKQDFIRFIIVALASNDETIDHLETLYETKSLHDDNEFKELSSRLVILGKKLNNFLGALQRDHHDSKNASAQEPDTEYINRSSNQNHASSDQHRL
jgi:four helix bundle protein